MSRPTDAKVIEIPAGSEQRARVVCAAHGNRPDELLEIFHSLQIELGFKKMVDDNSVISIEWADKVKDSLNLFSSEAKIIWVRLEYGKTENERRITYSDHFSD